MPCEGNVGLPLVEVSEAICVWLSDAPADRCHGDLMVTWALGHPLRRQVVQEEDEDSEEEDEEDLEEAEGMSKVKICLCLKIC